MFCPECSAEYRAGYTRCSDCDVALVSALPPEEREIDHDEEAVAVFVTREIVEAETVKEMLESNGIDVFVSGDSSPWPGVPSELRLIVSAEHADLANRIIEEAQTEAEVERLNVVQFPGRLTEEEEVE